MADRPPPGQAPAPPTVPTPTSTGVAPAGTVTGPTGPASPAPKPGRDPYPAFPGMLPGIDPATADRYTVEPNLLFPAASRADADADALAALGRGLALGAPGGLPGFATGAQAGALADAWSHELAVLSGTVRSCAAKIRATTQAYLDAEARNAAGLR